MTQLETGRPMAPIPRATGVGAPRIGVTESLAAPGVVPAIRSGRQYAEAADAIRRMVAGLAGVAGGLAELKTQDDRLDAGLATRHAREALVLTKERIDSGEFPMPDDGSEPDAVADQIEEATEGFSKTYKRAFGDAMGPGLLALIMARKSQVRKDAVDESFALLAQEASAAQSAKQLDNVLTKARDLGKKDGRTELNIANDVLLVAGAAAAAVGDTERAGWIAEKLHPLMPDKAEQLLKAAENERQRRNAEGLLEQIMSANTSTDAALRMVEQAQTAGDIAPGQATSLSGQVMARRHQVALAEQNRNREILYTDFALKRITLQQFADEIRHRTALPFDDPMHLDVDWAAAKLGQLEKKADPARQALLEAIRRDLKAAGFMEPAPSTQPAR